MARIEKQFINGLVRLFKPERILEIGVYEGSSSAIMLNAISDLPNSTLTSVELLSEVGSNTVGVAVKVYDYI